jgi:hypothetical protein
MCRGWGVAICGVCVVFLAAGCAEQSKPAGSPIERAWESPGGRNSPAASQSAARPAPPAQNSPTNVTSQPAQTSPPDDVLAVVNGTPIRRSTVTALLMESHGLSTLESLVLLTAARQKAAAMSLTVTQADIKGAHEDALRRLATPFVGTDRPPLDRTAAESLLREFLTAKNISLREWELRMEQRAIVAKIAAAEVARSPVTEKMLRLQYDQDFGEKVQVRHIQLASLAEVTRAKALLTEKDFELVAREMSGNEFTASQGGLMPPFTRDDPAVAPLLRQTAFALKVGEVSTAIHEQNRYQIIRVERYFPAGKTSYENTDKDKLRARVLDQLARQRMEDLEDELFRNAAVDIRDPNLSTQFRNKHRPQK